MASFLKRGNKWRCDVRCEGSRFSATFDSKKEAQLWAAKKIAEEKAFAKGELGKGKTWGDALKRYRDDVAPRNKGYKWDRIRIDMFLLDKTFCRKPIDKLTPDDFAQWRDNRLKEVSPSSVRREMALQGSVLKKCIGEWGWLKESPIRKVEKPKASPARDRLFSDAELEKLRKHFNYEVGEPVYLKKQLAGAFFELALLTGMRVGEMVGIRERHYFRSQKYVLLGDTKNGDPRKVPMSTKARKVMDDILLSGLHMSRDSLSATFYNARKKTGIEGARFHDTRHQACTVMSEKLKPMEMARTLGHRNLNQTLQYYNKSASDIADQLD